MGAPATVVPEHGLSMARVQVGHRQELRFRETAGSPRPYDGHHVAVYIADFSGPHRRLAERGLVSEESNPVQYRFKDIVDPDSGRVLATLDAARQLGQRVGTSSASSAAGAPGAPGAAGSAGPAVDRRRDQEVAALAERCASAIT